MVAMFLCLAVKLILLTWWHVWATHAALKDQRIVLGE